MTARHWWAGIGVLVAALVLHAAIPRYDWRPLTGFVWVRADRWTGHAEIGRFAADAHGRWMPVETRSALDREIDDYLASLKK